MLEQIILMIVKLLLNTRIKLMKFIKTLKYCNPNKKQNILTTLDIIPDMISN